MKFRSCNPDVVKERIIRLKSELRVLQVELRLAEAEARDREKYFPRERKEGQADAR
ncbi:MAG: hypothetical protein LAP85_29195 [Acidobacteriia bacterium]|nr:hypothetical protein [Terriglobia bacterium]